MQQNLKNDYLPRININIINQKKAINETSPYIITGIVQEWPATTKWNINYLKEQYGQLEVTVRDNRKIDYSAKNIQKIIHREKMLLRDYIDNIIEKDNPELYHYYMTELDPSYFPGLCNDFSTPIIIRNREHIKNFWLSPKNAYTRLHYDLGHNFLAQIIGEKKIILYSPNLSNLYPFPTNGASQVDIENPDYDKFPNFRFAKPIVCHLKAGEILYIPSCWWHQVYSIDDVNISVNFFWKPSVSYTVKHLAPLMRPKIINFIRNLDKIKNIFKNGEVG